LILLYLVRAVCLLQRKALLCLLAALESFAPSTREVSPFNGSRKPGDATNPRASSLVENLNSRLRKYFSSVVNWVPVSGLITVFLNHRTFMRSECPERWARVPPIDDRATPCSLAGALGFERFQRANSCSQNSSGVW